MRFIAHRILRDGEKLESLDERRLRGFHGVEMDLRLDKRGQLVVRHAPLFLAGGRPRKVEGHRFETVLEMLARLPDTPRAVLLDVKCVTAAAAAAALLRRSPPVADVTFVCWHEDEVAAIRAELPEIRILFCVAPIVARRRPLRSAARRIEDLWLCNSFPFVWSAQRFSPRLGKDNRHNINVKLIGSDRGITALPDGIDGLCVHRLFWNPALAALVAAEGLTVAVYGLSSRAQARLQARSGTFDLAIISAGRRERRLTRRSEARRVEPASPHDAAA